MADQPSGPATHDRPGTPRWVKAFAIGAVVSIFLVAAVTLIGGGSHGPGLHAPSIAAHDQASPSTAGIHAGGVGEPVNANEAARTVQVTTLDTMAFEPGGIDVSPGEAVTFVVTNGGQAVHEFTLGDATMQQEHADAMAHMPDGMAHDLPNSITLQPGETKELAWRFGQAGTLEYACHEPGHYEAGMRSQITIS